MTQMILTAMLLSFACSMDSFVSGFAYGANKVRIPFFSALIINIICSAILGAALFLGALISTFIPNYITLFICCAILISMGIHKIYLSIKNRDEKNFDFDNNYVLSGAEAVLFALALSIDGLAAGIGAGLMILDALSNLIIIAFSFLAGMASLYAGRFLGNAVAKKSPLNLSWLNGLLLICLAAVKIIL